MAEERVGYLLKSRVTDVSEFLESHTTASPVAARSSTLASSRSKLSLAVEERPARAGLTPREQ